MGDGLKGHVHYLCRIVFHKGCAVKACDVGSAVESVSAVHYVANPVCYVKRFREHAGRHQADEIGLNLEVKVVGVGVVEPVAAFRRHDALAHVVPSRLVGMGKVIGRVCKAQGKVLGRCVQTKLFKGLGKSEVVVDVVKETGLTVPPVLDVALAPADRNLFRDYCAAEFELCGSAVHYAYGLARPAALDLVHEGILGKGYGLGRFGRGTGGNCKKKGQYEAILLHKPLILLWI